MSGAICVDASVAVKWLLPEEDSEAAMALLRDAITDGTKLVGPPHLGVEVTSAVYRRMRQGDITREEMERQLERFSSITIETVADRGLPGMAVALALEFGWPLPYDAFYLAAGILCECEVWTADRRFHRDAGERYSQLRLIAGYRLA